MVSPTMPSAAERTTMATATLRSALDQPFPAGRAWAESALWRLGLHPDAELDVRHVAQGWMRLGVGDDATLVDTLFVLTDTQLGFGQVEVETTDPHWVPLSSIVAMVVAVPIAVGTALLITHYLRPRVGGTIGFLVDLLAAGPRR